MQTRRVCWLTSWLQGWIQLNWQKKKIKCSGQTWKKGFLERLTTTSSTKLPAALTLALWFQRTKRHEHGCTTKRNAEGFLSLKGVSVTCRPPIQESWPANWVSASKVPYLNDIYIWRDVQGKYNCGKNSKHTPNNNLQHGAGLWRRARLRREWVATTAWTTPTQHTHQHPRTQFVLRRESLMCFSLSGRMIITPCLTGSCYHPMCYKRQVRTPCPPPVRLISHPHTDTHTH